MKTILLTSTALVMSAGIAAAEVSLSGDGRMGVTSVEGGDIAFSSRVRIKIDASGETDNGLSFGASFRAADAVDARKGEAGSVFVTGPFGTVSMGSVDSAANTAVGQAGGVGFTGLGSHNEISYIANADKPSARWDYTINEQLSLHASADNPGPEGDQALSGGMGYSIGTVGFGVGVERMGDKQHIVAGVDAGLGTASVKVVISTMDDGNDATEDVQDYGASASFASGLATFDAFASRKGGTDYFGVGATYDLGGGAAIEGGYVDGDMEDASFDLGITMSF